MILALLCFGDKECTDITSINYAVGRCRQDVFEKVLQIISPTSEQESFLRQIWSRKGIIAFNSELTKITGWYIRWEHPDLA